MKYLWLCIQVMTELFYRLIIVRMTLNVSNPSCAITVPFTFIIEFSKLTFDNSERLVVTFCLSFECTNCRRVLNSISSRRQLLIPRFVRLHSTTYVEHDVCILVKWTECPQGPTRGENTEMESKTVCPSLLNRSFVKDARWEFKFFGLKKLFCKFFTESRSKIISMLEPCTD